MELAYLFTGLGLGFLAAWIIGRLYFTRHRLSNREIKERYVLKELHDNLQQQADLFRDDGMDKDREIRRLEQHKAGLEQQLQHIEDQLVSQKAEITRLQEHFRLEFENLASKLLEEKSRKFVNQNKEQLNHLLEPLKEKIKSFEDQIEKKYLEETKDRISLKKEIEQLRSLNQQLSQDAINLTKALKGDSKVQGDWGELQLELLFEKAGLKKDVHFLKQPSFADDNGRMKRPDYIVNLPEGKQLIVDSKVSLTHYERFFQEEDPDRKDQYLKAHLDSMRQHIRDLHGKKYQQLYGINAPDYVLLFVPIEPAFLLALQQDDKLFLDALDRNVVIVTASTLLATMRTVSFIWKQEKQKKSVQEIARQSGLLYDKFCNFVDDLTQIGRQLEGAQQSYQSAMNKLKDSRKYGDTLIGRAEKIRKLGAKTAKILPEDLLGEEDPGSGEQVL